MRVRDPGLLTVDDPVAARVFDRPRLNIGRIRASVRLGQREARVAFTFDGRYEVPLLLLFGTAEENVVGIAPEIE